MLGRTLKLDLEKESKIFVMKKSDGCIFDL